MASTASGLEGVVFAETVLSHVDGEKGELWIAGMTAQRLAEAGRFDRAVARLWGVGEEEADAQLGAARAAVSEAILARSEVRWPDPSAGLRSVLASLEGASRSELTAAAGLFAAASSRARLGGDPVRPDPSLPHEQDLVRMIRGSVDEARGRALGSYLCAVVDHGMNASTFVARVIASTGSDDTSAVTGAMGALKGPLHGGAPGPVLDMLEAIGRPEDAEAWIAEEIASGRRIMGMGHRIYRVRDPRVEILEQAIARLASVGIAADRLALARAVEQAAERALAAKKPERPLKANVEFATAVLLDAVGVPREAFTALFAASRIVGWLAHADEQRRVGKLVRPSSRYVGPVP